MGEARSRRGGLTEPRGLEVVCPALFCVAGGAAIAAVCLGGQAVRALATVALFAMSAGLVGLARGLWGIARRLEQTGAELAVLNERVGELSVRPAATIIQSSSTATVLMDVSDLRAQLEASQGANDAERVLELHASLAPRLSDEERVPLEQAVVKWLMSHLMRRLRAGSVAAEVPELASRIAEAFAATAEGASLRASLPTLRRSAGLCGRCAKPYTGVDEACPACLGPGRVAADAEGGRVISDLDELVSEDDTERRLYFAD